MSKANIMIVEDEFILADDLKSCLEDIGYDVCAWETSGEAAIKQAGRKRPDIVLMDIVLEGELDGIQAANQIRSQFNIPIIFLSAFSDPEIRERVKMADSFGYLLKPFDIKELNIIIEMGLYKAEMEEKLRESEEKYRLLAETANDIIITCDLEGRITYMNKAGVEISGYSEAEVLKMSLSDILPHDQFEILKTYFEKQPVKKNGLSLYETAFISKEGTRIPIEVSSSALIKGDRPFGALFSARNITVRKKLEMELLNAKKFESIGILAGGIAHDFNNLLTVVLGNVSMAKDEIPPGHTFEMLTDAEKASLSMGSLTNQLFTFSRNSISFKKAGSLSEMIRETPAFISADSNTVCNFSIADDLWPAEFNEDQMKIAIRNLITNAEESMPKGGIIDVCAENIMKFPKNTEQEGSLKGGKYVRIAIRDHGVGISEEHLPLVFDPYFSTKERGTQKGMGMGLSTAYAIIKGHGGYISVESGTGVGTAFHIYLPAFVKEMSPIASEKRNYEKKEDIGEKTVAKKRKILVMDDEKLVRNIVLKMLNRFGYEVVLTKNSDETVAQFKDAQISGRPFDAVILDLTIREGIGAKEVIRKLEMLDPQVKAIVSSGYSNDPVIRNFMRYGFKGAIPKPCPMKELKKIMHEILMDV